MSRKLWSPPGYDSLTPDYIKAYLNKCGGDFITEALVPNSILGVDISSVCNIHDYMYLTGKTAQDRKFADEVFVKNLDTIIESKSRSKVSQLIRSFIAKAYKFAVRAFGHLYFQSGK